MHDRLKRAQITTSMSRNQAVSGNSAIVAVFPFAFDFESGGIVGQSLDVEIVIRRKRDSRWLQRQQEHQF
ncbi:MAG: hypothetical protein DRQ62_12730 [Gammaproteobacteria bacterium]|nr:MAG: hypothetical protein DRQ62_12730 [Gammaproteobacteria bacterium]